MEIFSDSTSAMFSMPRFDDGVVGMRVLLRRLAEQVVKAVMDAEPLAVWQRDEQSKRILSICSRSASASSVS